MCDAVCAIGATLLLWNDDAGIGERRDLVDAARDGDTNADERLQYHAEVRVSERLGTGDRGSRAVRAVKAEGYDGLGAMGACEG